VASSDLPSRLPRTPWPRSGLPSGVHRRPPDQVYVLGRGRPGRISRCRPRQPHAMLFRRSPQPRVRPPFSSRGGDRPNPHPAFCHLDRSGEVERAGAGLVGSYAVRPSATTSGRRQRPRLHLPRWRPAGSRRRFSVPTTISSPNHTLHCRSCHRDASLPPGAVWG
jgi:hypothetical protein